MHHRFYRVAFGLTYISWFPVPFPYTTPLSSPLVNLNQVNLLHHMLGPSNSTVEQPLALKPPSMGEETSVDDSN